VGDVSGGVRSLRNKLVGLTSRSGGETFVVLAGRVLTALTGLGFVLVTARNMGPVGRGQIAVAFTVAWVATGVGDLGAAVGARLSLLAGTVRLGSESVVWSLFLFVPFQLLTAILIMGVLAVGGWTADDAMSFTVGVSALTVGSAVANTADHLAYGCRAYRLVAVTWSVVSLLQLLVVGGLWASDSLSVPAAVHVMAVTQAAGGFWMVIRIAPGGALRLGPSAVVARRLVRDGLSAGIGGLARFVAFRVDRIILAALLGVRSAGVFAVAAVLPETLRMASRSFAQVIGDRLRSGALDRGRLPVVVGRFLFGYMVSLVLVALLGPPTVTAVFGDVFGDAERLLPVLALAEGLLAVHLLYDGVFMGLASPSRIGVPSPAGAVVNVVACMILIPRVGVVGAAWSSVLGYGGMAIASAYWVRHAGLERSPTGERRR